MLCYLTLTALKDWQVVTDTLLANSDTSSNSHVNFVCFTCDLNYSNVYSNKKLCIT